MRLINCIKNLPEVARKNSKPATTTIKIMFLYNLELPNEPGLDLDLDLKINKITTITAKTINNLIISFFYI